MQKRLMIAVLAVCLVLAAPTAALAQMTHDTATPIAQMTHDTATAPDNGSELLFLLAVGVAGLMLAAVLVAVMRRTSATRSEKE